MSGISDIIISDTSCLIILDKIDELELLRKVGKQVYVTPAIQEEFGKPLPDWILVRSPEIASYHKILKLDLDKGEASAIALSFILENPILIIDELKGRNIAEKLKLRYSGTFGLILIAKRNGSIKSVKPILEKIKSTNFRFNHKLIEAILKLAGE